MLMMKSDVLLPCPLHRNPIHLLHSGSGSSFVLLVCLPDLHGVVRVCEESGDRRPGRGHGDTLVGNLQRDRNPEVVVHVFVYVSPPVPAISFSFFHLCSSSVNAAVDYRCWSTQSSSAHINI